MPVSISGAAELSAAFEVESDPALAGEFLARGSLNGLFAIECASGVGLVAVLAHTGSGNDERIKDTINTMVNKRVEREG